MELYPLSMTRCDWNQYIKIVEKALGFSPTRGLDNERIATSDPNAFLATLSLDNDPLKNLRSGQELNGSFNHIHLSLIGISNSETILMIVGNTKLRAISKSTLENNSQKLVIFTGSIADWQNAVVVCSQDYLKKSVKSFATVAYNIFVSMGFKDVWSDFNQIHQKDGTWTLKRK